MPSVTHKRQVSVACDDGRMATRTDPAVASRAHARRLARGIGEQLRIARTSAGLSQQHTGLAAAMSHAQWGRIERGAVGGLSFDQVARAASAVGLRLVARLVPDGDPVRDAAHLALLDRLRRVLPATVRWDTEVPLPIPGDRRAWDALLRTPGRRAGCEAETRLDDVQALERRLALKLRDGEVDVLILAVADTAANRHVLRAHRADLRALLPLDGREVLRALRGGSLPARNGLVVL